MKIKITRNPFKTKLSQAEIEQNFSNDINGKTYPFEVSINHCEDTEDYDNKVDSAFSFMLKFKAFYTKDPRYVKKGLAGFIVPEDGYDIRHEPGDPCHFDSVEDNHHNAHYRDSGEIQKVSSDLKANWNSSCLNYGQKEIDDYLMATYERDDWETFYQLPNYENWQKRLKQAFVRKFVASFGEISKENLGTTYASKPQEMEAQIEVLKKLNAVTETKMKRAFDTFVKNNNL